MTKGIFGGMFDFNRDGQMGVFERAAEFQFLNHLMAEAEKEEAAEALEAEGLDFDDLEYMDEDERNEILEEAGLDPDDYDFD